jgi:hypothetical protein
VEKIRNGGKKILKQKINQDESPIVKIQRDISVVGKKLEKDR